MPTRIKLFGDTQRADQYRFIAYRKHLADALKLRSFQGLAIYRHQVRIPGGGMVDVVCHHNDNEIAIYMPPRPRPQPEELERRPAIACVVSIGSDDAGHHFFLWDPAAGQKMSGIQRAATLNDLYTRFYPVQQDHVYRIMNSYGGHPYQVFGYNEPDAPWSPQKQNCELPRFDQTDSGDDLTQECSTQMENTYEHPLEGEQTDIYGLHKYYVDAVGDDEPWWGIWDWTFDMPFVGNSNRSLFRANRLKPIADEALLARNVCNATEFAVKIPHYHIWKDQDIGQQEEYFRDSHEYYDIHYYGNTLYMYEDYEYETPPGKMRRLRGKIYKDVPDMEDDKQIEETKLRFGTLPRYKDDSTMYGKALENAMSGTMTLPFRQEKNAYGFPVSNTDAKHSSDIQAKQSEYGFCQAFLMSWVEWKGHSDTPNDLNSWSQVDTQDVVYVAAASDTRRPESGLERNEALEQEIANLVMQATQDQREAGTIDGEQAYKGQLNFNFTDAARVEQEQLERAMMMEFLRILNEARENNGVEPLRWNFTLEDAAVRHSVDLALNKPVSGSDPHTGSDGSSAFERIFNAGYLENQRFQETEEGYAAGENILWLTLGVEPNTPQRAFERWKASYEHWDNMIYADYRETALDIRYTTGSDGHTYAIWVQEFGYNWYNEQ